MEINKEIKLAMKQLKKQTNRLYSLIIDEEKDKLKPVVCDKCGYSWETISKLCRVTCPNCNSTVFLLSKKEKDERMRMDELNKD